MKGGESVAEQRRVSTRVHTREIDRGVARRQMKLIGMRRVAKHDHHGRGWQLVYDRSYFANHWREYCVGGNNKKEDK